MYMIWCPPPTLPKQAEPMQSGAELGESLGLAANFYNTCLPPCLHWKNGGREEKNACKLDVMGELQAARREALYCNDRSTRTLSRRHFVSGFSWPGTIPEACTGCKAKGQSHQKPQHSPRI